MLRLNKMGKVVSVPVDSTRLVVADNLDEPEEYFTWRGCANCNDEAGKTLGASVYSVMVYLDDDFRDWWELELCSKCRYEAEYGIGSYEA